MTPLIRYTARPSRCGYLPDQLARMEYEHVLRIEPEDYRDRMLQGWRRFGHTLFRPRCRACSACQPLRVDVRRFRPDRSQRRVRDMALPIAFTAASGCSTASAGMTIRRKAKMTPTLRASEMSWSQRINTREIRCQRP